MNNKERAFSLVEIAIVLVIIGIIVGSILKGYDLIKNAKTRRLLNDMKGLVSYQFTFLDRYGRFAGDGDGDGKVDYEFLVATADDIDNVPQNQYIERYTPDIDAPFSDLEASGFLPVGDHLEFAKHSFNDIYYFSQVDGFNVLVVRNIPCYAAMTIDKDIDKVMNARNGYIREAKGATDSLGAVGDEDWSDICHSPETLVSIVFFYDNKPN